MRAKKKSAEFCELSPVTLKQRVCQSGGERELKDTKAECQKTQIIVGAFTGFREGQEDEELHKSVPVGGISPCLTLRQEI